MQWRKRRRRPATSLGVIFDHTGLAFSGGGIRSATFCLGAVQALQAQGMIRAVDYLSTVSGGGYIGCSLVASMGSTGVFPFAARADASGTDEASINDLQDSAAVQHIRDYSNYLMPRGLSDLTLSIGVILRGLVASASLVVGPMLLLAALATWLHPSRNDLITHDAFGIPIDKLALGHFLLTTIVLLALVAFLFVWALARSRDEARGGAPYEFTSNWPGVARWILGALVVVAFLEAQPLAVLSLFDTQNDHGGWLGLLAGNLITTLATFAQILAPIAGIITLLAGRLSEVIKANAVDPTWKGQAAKVSSQALLTIAAIVVPALLWIGWLYLIFWATATDSGKSLLSAHMPSWVNDRVGNTSLSFVYFLGGAAVTGVSWLMEPNANSLHRLYRDRLSDAFLFLTRTSQESVAASKQPKLPLTRTRPATASSSQDDVAPLDSLKLSELNTDRAPYLLINTALNIHGSPYVNKRGRNADFFLFSRDYVGSHATGFVPTAAIEEVHPALDLGTAMAISGASASSNMGANSIRILAPTLALLNVRLGYGCRTPH